MNNKYGLVFKFVIVFLAILNTISTLFLFYNLGKNSASKQSVATIADSGKVQIQVLETNTNKPIDAVTICIIETRHYENTNKYGMTSLITIPIIRNTNYDLALGRNWGEITILAYKNGYADNINFYTSIMPGATRVGIIIHLTPIISEEDNQIEVNLENPNKVWIESLIKLYKKRI